MVKAKIVELEIDGLKLVIQINVVGAGELNPYLIKVYGKASNRGVGDRLAEISYTNTGSNQL